MLSQSKKSTLIIGAGPAGLTAAYQLSQKGHAVTVLESDPNLVGGISKTVNYAGFLIDIGGHRFYTKSESVNNFWNEILKNDLKLCKRKSRIYYQGKFFQYPLVLNQALKQLGLCESIVCLISYLKAVLKPRKTIKSFEDWMVNHFGKRLFNIFFKTYTEKVWGMKCNEISSDWATQRIRQLSLFKLLWHSLGFNKNCEFKPFKTLIDTFHYPTQGPGMLWEKTAKKIKSMGSQIQMNHFVQKIEFDTLTKKWKVDCNTHDGIHSYFSDNLISSAPLGELVKSLSPKAPEEIIEAAKNLKYRDFIIVCLILLDKNLFSDQWIYIHDPNVKVGRIQNFKAWSKDMVPNPNQVCFGLEYFTSENDNLWNCSDNELLKLAKNEFSYLGFSKIDEVIDGCVIRQKKAYPIYDNEYQKHICTVRNFLENKFSSLHLVGRNGMHRYNNQDHAIKTAMLVAENILAEKKLYNPWLVDQDAQYQEVMTANEPSFLFDRAVPIRMETSTISA